jgi:hypothetical protein
LYYGNKKRHELLYSISAYFFDRLFHIYVDRIVINICKATDPAKQGKKENLSVEFLEEQARPLYGGAQGQTIISLKNRLVEIRNQIEPWRHKFAVHTDKPVVMGEQILNTKFYPNKAIEFYGLLQEYLDILHDIAGEPRLNINVPNHADELIKALQEAHAFRTLFEQDPMKYDDILRKDHFSDA